MTDSTQFTRRRLIGLAGIGMVSGLAGCSSGSGGNSKTCSGKTPPSGQVAQKYRTAKSRGGMKRNPNSLQPKSALDYRNCPHNGAKCSDCTFFVPPQGDDSFGACVKLKGYINPNGWCSGFG